MVSKKRAYDSDSHSSSSDESYSPRKKTKKNYAVTNVNNYTFNHIAQYFQTPISNAASQLKVSQTYLKRLCRHFEIYRWPYRKLNCMQRKIDALRAMAKSKNGRSAVAAQAEIDRLQKDMKMIMSTGSLSTKSCGDLSLDNEEEEVIEEEKEDKILEVKEEFSQDEHVCSDSFDNEELDSCPTFMNEEFYPASVSFMFQPVETFIKTEVVENSTPLGLHLDVDWLEQVFNSGAVINIM
jgi:hypothetical protein